MNSESTETECSSYIGPLSLLLIAVILPWLIYIVFGDENNFSGVGIYFTPWEALYFSVVTFTTLGYGDIYPLGSLRFIAAIQALLGPVTVGYFLYVYGKKIQAREERAEVRNRAMVVLKNKIRSHDKRQKLYRDFLRAHTGIFNSLQLEYTVARKNVVSFYAIEQKEIQALFTQYYDFARNIFLVGRYCEELEGLSSPRRIYKIQSIIDSYLATLEGLVSASHHYNDFDTIQIDYAVTMINNISALRARVVSIKDLEKHSEDYQKEIDCYIDDFTEFLTGNSACIRKLIGKTSIRVLTDELFFDSSDVIKPEERKMFLQTIDVVQTNRLIHEYPNNANIGLS